MDKTPHQIRKVNVTIGADPEMFLYYQNHTPVSAIGLIGGTKHNPAPLGREGFFVQEDNVLVEFNIPPAKTMEEFVESIEWSKETIRKVVNANGLSIQIKATERFPDSELQHPKAQELGCDPDYNAWTGQVNPRPVLEGHMKNIRSAGGHIHIGWEQAPDDPPMFRRQVIKAMDLFVGVPSVKMDMNWARRELYGKAGAYRTASYGVEYRTPSNFWLRDAQYAQWAYMQSKRAFDFACNMNNWNELDDLVEPITKAINSNHTTEVNRLVAKYQLVDHVH